MSCGRLSWLLVCVWAHINIVISYHIIAKLDSLHWFPQRRSPMPHFWGCAPRGLWPPNSISAEILVQCTCLQVSSPYVYSFRSYHVNEQTDKQTSLKTCNALLYTMITSDLLSSVWVVVGETFSSVDVDVTQRYLQRLLITDISVIVTLRNSTPLQCETQQSSHHLHNSGIWGAPL